MLRLSAAALLLLPAYHATPPPCVAPRNGSKLTCEARSEVRGGRRMQRREARQLAAVLVGVDVDKASALVAHRQRQGLTSTKRSDEDVQVADDAER